LFDFVRIGTVLFVFSCLWTFGTQELKCSVE
jgi:hypothetical protein